jgi:hypothetical protein
MAAFDTLCRNYIRAAVVCGRAFEVCFDSYTGGHVDFGEGPSWAQKQKWPNSFDHLVGGCQQVGRLLAALARSALAFFPSTT